MQRDDRLFYFVLTCVVGFAATVLLILGYGGRGGGRAPSADATLPPAEAAASRHEGVDRDRERIAGGVQLAVLDSDRAADVEIGAALASAGGPGIAEHAGLASWLAGDDLVRRGIALVDAVAEGRAPGSEMALLGPWRQFLVREDDQGRLVIAAGTMRRYTPLVTALRSLDAERLVEVYQRLRPAIAEASSEGEAFEDRLRRAIDHLLAVDVARGPIEVEQRSRYYAFADDEYERLSAAQKHLVKMGARNAGYVQAKLRELRDALGLAPSLETGGVMKAAIEEVPIEETPVQAAALDDLSLVAPEPLVEMETGAPAVDEAVVAP